MLPLAMDTFAILRNFTMSVLIVSLFALPPVVVALWPSAGEPVVVLGDDVLTAVADAGGRLIAASDDRRSVVAQVGEAGDRDFVARLFRAGAHAVLAAPSSAACTITRSRSFSSANDPRD